MYISHLDIYRYCDGLNATHDSSTGEPYHCAARPSNLHLAKYPRKEFV